MKKKIKAKPKKKNKPEPVKHVCNHFVGDNTGGYHCVECGR